MFIYSVTIAIAAAIEQEWLEWMQQVHVPDVLQTGCFSECHIYKVTGDEGEERSYVLQYHCASLAEYERYRDNSAPALQKEHSEKFVGKFRGSRQVLEQIAIAKQS